MNSEPSRNGRHRNPTCFGFPTAAELCSLERIPDPAHERDRSNAGAPVGAYVDFENLVCGQIAEPRRANPAPYEAITRLLCDDICVTVHTGGVSNLNAATGRDF